MNLRNVNLLPIVLMLFLAALTFWLRITMESPVKTDADHKRHDLDAIINQFTVTRLDDRGNPRYSLSAERMLHYADDKMTEVTAPKIVQRSDGATTTITAEHGTVTRDGDEAFFRGNVLVVRTAAAKGDVLRVRTNFLHVLPEKNIARTNEAVVVTDGRSTLSGVGMEFNEKTRKITFFSHVRGSFDQADR